jgi:hypothetical protein|tara:strand:+ start:4713 stop:4886 length:174 start_codon:yes stop_codon:yes gene_type:complete
MVEDIVLIVFGVAFAALMLFFFIAWLGFSLSFFQYWMHKPGFWGGVLMFAFVLLFWT